MSFNKITENDLNFLRSFLKPEQVSTGESNLRLHSSDLAHHKNYLPEVVVWPESTEQVSAILKMANDRLIPVTPWGAGTSLEGNCCPVFGGLVLDLQLMNKILAARPEDFQVDVQAGVTYKDMNKELSRYGLFFPPDPGANATIGGMVANNASGIRTIKYGATRDNVLSLQIVLASGQIMRLGTRAHKTSSGYDLVRLIVGSEGTLAVVTEITLKLMGLPESLSAGVAIFETIPQATDSVYEIMSHGLIPTALELLDAEAIAYVNRENTEQMAEKATLFIEFSGSNDDSLARDLRQAREICQNNQCLGFQMGLDRKERNRLWSIRHGFGESLIRGNPGLDVVIMDTAVPLSEFSGMVEFATRTAAAHGLKACVSSHAGDGNLHLNVVGQMQDKDFVRRLNQAYEKIIDRAIAVGGTATGEHGIGVGKRQFMVKEHGDSVQLMQGIKNYFDPRGILNPGKMLP